MITILFLVMSINPWQVKTVHCDVYISKGVITEKCYSPPSKIRNVSKGKKLG